MPSSKSVEVVLIAYSFQVYSVGQVLTAAAMNQEEVNIRDHIHGVAGVLDPQTLKPQATNTYDLGAPALQWRQGYITTIRGQERRIFQDFLGVTDFTVTSVAAGGLLFATTIASRGLRTFSGANATNNAGYVSVTEYAHIHEWGLVTAEIVMQVNSDLDASSGRGVAAGLLAPGLDMGNAAAWMQVNSGFIRPRTARASATTDGTDIAFVLQSMHIFRVEATVNTATFYFNGSLQQALSTNITSAAVTAHGGWKGDSAGRNNVFFVHYLDFNVTSA